MRILVTNDDGVEAPGIHALAAALHGAGHDVVVVAPSGERSGSGAATGRIHRSGPVVWTRLSWPELPDVTVHSVDLTPAVAVYAAVLGPFGGPFDVVASGINHGLNYGHLALHSGTVGAALTAVVLGVPSLAVSLAWGDDEHWDTACTLALAALGPAAALAPPAALNLNVPNRPLAELGGVASARPAPFAERWTVETKPGELQLTYEGLDETAPDEEPEPDDPDVSDLALVRAGWASVTVLTTLAAVDAGPVTQRITAALDG